MMVCIFEVTIQYCIIYVDYFSYAASPLDKKQVFYQATKYADILNLRCLFRATHV